MLPLVAGVLLLAGCGSGSPGSQDSPVSQDPSASTAAQPPEVTSAPAVTDPRESMSRVEHPEIGTPWRGSGGQLFIGDDLVAACADHGAVTGLEQTLDQTNPGSTNRVRMLVVADKSVVYRDRLSPSGNPAELATLSSCLDAAKSNFEELQSQRPDQFAYVAASDDAASRWKQPAFHRGDTHWTPAGATAIPLRLGPWLTNSELSPAALTGDLIASRRSAKCGDLYALTGQDKSESYPIIDLKLPGVGRSTPDPQAAVSPNQGPSNEWSRSCEFTKGALSWSTKKAPIGGRTLVLGDSLFTGAIASTVPLFAHVTFVRLSEIASFAQSQANSRAAKFDCIIVEMVQRSVPEVVKAGWLAPDRLSTLL